MSGESPEASGGGFELPFRVRVVAQVGIVAALIALLVTWDGYSEVTSLVKKVGWDAGFAFMGLMVAVRLVAACRWLEICRSGFDMEEPSYWYLFRTMVFGQFVNIWIPSFLGGEAVRVWKLQRLDLDWKRSSICVLVDRAVGFGGVALASLPLLAYFPRFARRFSEVSLPNWVVVAGLVGLVAVVAVAIRKRETAWSIYREARDEFASWRLLVLPSLYAVLGVGCVVAAYGVLGRPLGVDELVVVAAISVLPRFGRLVPVAVLGVGAVEGGTFVIGRALGVQSEVLAVIVAAHIASRYVVAMLGGLLEMVHEGPQAVRVWMRDDGRPVEEKSQ